MALREIQQAFLDIAIQFCIDHIKDYFSTNPSDTVASQVDVLDTAGTALDVVNAGILVGGAIAAPGTAGISLGVAGAIVVLAKAGQAFYQYAKHAVENPDAIEYPVEINKKVVALRLRVQLQRALFLFTLRYADILESVVDKRSLRRFAEQTVLRLAKFAIGCWEASKTDILMAEDLLDLLLSSAKISVTKDTDSISIQHTKKSTLYSKYLWALPIWYIYDEEGNGEFIGSQHEHYYTKTTTHIECGVIALPREKLQLTKLAVDFHSYKKLSAEDLGRPLSELKKGLLIQYIVSLDEVKAYLDSFQQTGGPVKTLNEYLSEQYNKPIIACCHDARFKGFDFKNGWYSDVDFSGADLSDSDLRFSRWVSRCTWLVGTVFGRVRLSHESDFQAVHAEESLWTDVCFTNGVNFIETKLNGAVFVRCEFDKAGLMQMGTDWWLARFIELKLTDRQIEFEKAFHDKLTKEEDERCKLQRRVSLLTASLERETKEIDGLKRDDTGPSSQVWMAIQSEMTELKHASAQIPTLKSQIVLLQEQYTYLEKAYLHRKIGDNALQQFRHEETKRWSEQYQADTQRDLRLTRVEHMLNVVNRLTHFCQEEIDTSNFQFIKKSFVELSCAPFLHGNENIESLTECIDSFILNGAGCFLLHGAPGSGRTTFLKLLFIELIDKLVHAQSSLIPILIDMYEVRDLNRNTLRVAMETRLPPEQVDKIIESGQVLLMVDNLDVETIPFSRVINDFIELGARFKFPPKFIFSTKTNHLLSLERDYREFFCDQRFVLYKERCVQPLDQQQIRKFFSHYHRDSLYQRVCVLQTANPVVRSMLQSPLLLSLLVGAFHASGVTEEQLVLRGDFYAASWRALYEHVRYLLPEYYKNYAGFTDLIQSIAVSIYQNGSDWVARARHLTTSEQERDALAHLLRGNVRYLSFLLITQKNTVLDVRFLHPSLGHYWVAQKLLDDLYTNHSLSQGHLQLWNRHNLRDYPDVLGFLVDFIQKLDVHERAEVMSKLMAIIMQTADSKQRHSILAASNAMTLRCRLYPSLDGLVMDDVQIPGFDGSGVTMVGASFRRANLKNAWLIDACMLWANMDDADLSGVRFLKASSFVQLDDGHPLFVVYPSLEPVIAYVIRPSNLYQGYHIALMAIQEDRIEKIVEWAAHIREIHALALGLCEDEKTVWLASAGEGGTIRIWALNGKHGHVSCVTRLHGVRKIPVNVLAWSPDMKYIASGNHDMCVRVWDVTQSKKIYKSKTFQASAIRALIWSKQNYLFAIDDGPILHRWYQPQDALPDSRWRSFDLTLIFSKIYLPIRHMAMSSDGRYIAFAQSHRDVLVMSIEEEPYREYIVFRGHQLPVNEVCWAGKSLISVSDDETCRIWYNHRYHRILPHGQPVRSVALSTNEQEVLLGVSQGSFSPHGGTKIYFWNIYPFQEDRLSKSFLGTVACLATHALSSNMLDVVAGFVNGCVMRYRVSLDEKKTMGVLLWEHSGVSVWQISWSDDGRYLASLSLDGVMMMKDMFNDSPPVVLFQTDISPSARAFAWIKRNNAFYHLGVTDFSGGWSLYAINHCLQKKSDTDHQILTEVTKIVSISTTHSPPIQCFAVLCAPQTPQIVLCALAREEMVEIWSVDLQPEDLAQHSCLKKALFSHPNKGAFFLCWSSQGHYLASLDRLRSTVYVWSESFVCLLVYTHLVPIRTLLWHNDDLIAGTQYEVLRWVSSQSERWEQSFSAMKMGMPILNAINQFFVIADQKAIWICHVDRLWSQKNATAWVLTIKPDLLAHGAMCSAQLSETNKMLLKQRGACIKASTFRFFNWRDSRPQADSMPLPRPITPAELRQLLLSRQCSIPSLKGEDSASNSAPSPRRDDELDFSPKPVGSGRYL